MERQEENREADEEAKQRRGLAALARQRRLHASGTAVCASLQEVTEKEKARGRGGRRGVLGVRGYQGLKIDHSWAD